MKYFRKVIFLFFLFSSCVLHAQFFLGVKFMGLSFHPGKNVNAACFKSGIGKNKRIALNFGLAVTAEYKFNYWFSVKLDQAAFRDCGGKFAGMTMFNLRYTQNLGVMGEGSVGFGPFFFYRKSWKSFEGYVDEGYFKCSKNEKWQRKFVWYGGELEHDLPLKNGMDLSTNIFPGIPVVYALASGLRFSNPK
jgi:hypothetical protein